MLRRPAPVDPDDDADARVVSVLKRRLPDAVKRDLYVNGRDLPGWALPLARDVAGRCLIPRRVPI